MADKKQHIIYSKADIENYLQGKMSKEAMHSLERAALQDGFLADAIEGYRFADASSSDKNLAAIEAMILANKQDAKVVPITTKKNSWLKIAVAVILFIGAGFVGLLLMNKGNKEAIASNNKVTIKPAQQSVPAVDSIKKDELALNEPKPKQDEAVVAIQNAPKKEIVAADKSIITENKADDFDSNKNAVASVEQLKEVVVQVPYGTVKKTAFTGSVATISAKQNVASNKSAGPSVSNNAMNLIVNNDAKREEAAEDKVSIAQNDSLVPINGWAAFNEYLQQNNQIRSTRDTTYSMRSIADMKTSEKLVELEFQINKSGTPKKIKVTKSVDSTTDAKAIDLLKNGPKWTGKDHKQKGKIAIKF